MIESEARGRVLSPAALCSPAQGGSREVNGAGGVAGHRTVTDSRSLLGDLWPGGDRGCRGRGSTTRGGQTTEWKSTALRAYQRRTRHAEFA